MPDAPKQPTPSDPLVARIAKFLEDYHDAMDYNITILKIVENTNQVNGNGYQVGLLGRQAANISRIAEVLIDAVTTDKRPVSSAQLQEEFALAVGAINMIIGEHDDLASNTTLRSGSDRLERVYRKKFAIPKEQDLSDKDVKRITKKQNHLVREVKELAFDKKNLESLRDELNIIRAEITGKGKTYGDTKTIGPSP